LNPELVKRARAVGFEAFDDIAQIGGGKTFDVILAFDVLEHLTHDQIARFLDQVANLLAPGGIFIARFPNADSPLSGVYQHADVSHITQIGSAKIRYFCNLLGLNLEYLGRPAIPRAAGAGEKIKQSIGNFLRRSIESVIERLYLPYPVPFD